MLKSIGKAVVRNYLICSWPVLAGDNRRFQIPASTSLSSGTALKKLRFSRSQHGKLEKKQK